MSAPGGATTVGEIVGLLRLDRSDWIRGVRDTERDADRIGRLNPNIRIGDNTGAVIGRLELVRAATDRVGNSNAKMSASNGGAAKSTLGLVEALALVAPAAVPIGAVASGALAGLLPLTASVALGVKGISEEYKAGSLEGSKYAGDIRQLTGELQHLEQITAGGLLGGLDKGLAVVTQEVVDGVPA
jgi:hypothetical protein